MHSGTEQVHYEGERVHSGIEQVHPTGEQVHVSKWFVRFISGRRIDTMCRSFFIPVIATVPGFRVLCHWHVIYSFSCLRMGDVNRKGVRTVPKVSELALTRLLVSELTLKFRD